MSVAKSFFSFVSQNACALHGICDIPICKHKKQTFKYTYIYIYMYIQNTKVYIDVFSSQVLNGLSLRALPVFRRVELAAAAGPSASPGMAAEGL